MTRYREKEISYRIDNNPKDFTHTAGSILQSRTQSISLKPSKPSEYSAIASQGYTVNQKKYV